MKRTFNLFAVIVIICMAGAIAYKIIYKEKVPQKPKDPSILTPVVDIEKMDYKLFNQLYLNKSNYLISPLSIAYALNMVNDGANNNTKTQIDKIINDYSLPKINNIPNVLGMANSIFIKEDFKQNIREEYINTLNTKYGAELKYDTFENADNINKWVNEKTFGMIPKLTESVSKELVLVLMNALAIDIDWKNQFKCSYTSKYEFTKSDGSKKEVSMMRSDEGDILTYIESDTAKGIIKPYVSYDLDTGSYATEETSNSFELEYIAILPNENINDYLKTFNEDELNNLLNNKREASSTLQINLLLPKYSYDYDFELKDALVNLGMTDAFTENIADFSNILIENPEVGVYISKAIHKTHIELNEKGTKAAAVTAFMLDKNTSIRDEKEMINVTFDKPFLYLIVDKNTKNIWFMGTVFDPDEWDNNKNCKSER